MKKALLGCLLTMAVAFVFLNPCPSLAGPFGTNMGDAKEKFKNLIDAGDNNYLTRDVPLRHSVFAEYFLLFGENGLNGVIAQSTYKNDRFGIQAQNAYKKVKEQLIKKYGEPEIKEFLREGALFKDDSEFVMSLYKSERVHACVWELKKPIDNIKCITLLLSGEGVSTCNIIISYSYLNREKYEEKKAALENDAL